MRLPYSSRGSEGTSTVIGVILIVATMIAVVAFVGFTVFDIGSDGNQVTGVPELSVTWLDVGQADSIIIQSDQGDNMVIDTGDFTDDGKTTLDYLEREEVNRVDHLVSSHQDADHIGGHEAVIQSYGSSGIGNVYDNGITRSTNTAEEYVNAVSNQGLSITEVEEGDEIPFDGAEVEVLNPETVEDSGSLGSDNDVVVLKLTHGDNRMLFSGDAESGSESRIVDANSDLDVDVMHVPHHGSSTSSTDKLLNTLDPEIGVISAPFDSQFGHPSDEVVNRYKNRNTELYWTAANGNVTITSDGKDIQRSVEKGSVNDVTKDSNYDISIQSIDRSVEQGSTVNIEFNVVNNGDVPDIQDIDMDVSDQNGNPIDKERNIKLVESESSSGTLSWITSNDQKVKDYTITTSSEDESISRTVSITNNPKMNDSRTNDPATNALKNPSFESGSGADADDWIEIDTAGSGRSSKYSFDGSQSMAMKDLTSRYGGRALESSTISVSSGETYEFSAYYYLPSSEAEFSGTVASDYRYKTELVWLDSSGTELSDEQVSADAEAFDAWMKVTATGSAPQNAVEAELRIDAYEDNNNDGNIYWDSAFAGSSAYPRVILPQL